MTYQGQYLRGGGTCRLCRREIHLFGQFSDQFQKNLPTEHVFHAHFLFYQRQPDSQGLHLRYPRYGKDPDTGWPRGTQILGA